MLAGTKNSEVPMALAELPPFPAVLIRALQFASNSDSRLRELHDVVSADPVFARELLKTANSPLYGLSTPIKSTLQAAIVLGYRQLKALVLTVGTRAYLGTALQIPVLRACWHHSLACAMVAEDLVLAGFISKSGRWARVDKDFVYTAGILHDVGRLALAVLRPTQYATFLKSTEKQPCDVLDQEQVLFGFDHAQTGGALVTAWELGAEFTEITEQHHKTAANTLAAAPSDALAVVRFSCMMADAVGFQAARTVNGRSYEELIGELPECERQYFGPSRDEYASRIARNISAIESGSLGNPAPAMIGAIPAASGCKTVNCSHLRSFA